MMLDSLENIDCTSRMSWGRKLTYKNCLREKRGLSQQWELGCSLLLDCHIRHVSLINLCNKIMKDLLAIYSYNDNNVRKAEMPQRHCISCRKWRRLAMTIRHRKTKSRKQNKMLELNSKKPLKYWFLVGGMLIDLNLQIVMMIRFIASP